MNELSNLTPAEGAVRKKKRIGRGESSGWGKTAGRGMKGQKSRSGGGPARGFEGGQMPLARRLPKRGFVSRSREEIAIINVGALANFEAGTIVDEEFLRTRGLIKKRATALKILGDGEISVSLTVKAHKFSKSAVQKIESAGGTVEILGS
ncbi:MAG: 50S ribosomal protein L15 [Bradymonadia bacterium]